MNSVFVIQQRDGRFLSRQHEWVDAAEPQAVFRTPHHDLAVNELFELTARHTELRARVAQVQTDARGVPILQALAPPDFPAPVRDRPSTCEPSGASAAADVDP